MNIEDYLDDIPMALLSLPEGRRELTKYDPMLFALLYLPHHLKNSEGVITLSEFHHDLAKYGEGSLNLKDGTFIPNPK